MSFEKSIHFLKLRLHSIIFSIFGLFIIGVPISSAKQYMCYLIGLVLVWCLPLTKNKLQIYVGYLIALILTVAKIYALIISPNLEVKLFPAYTYDKKLLINNIAVPESLNDQLISKFKKNVEVDDKFSHSASLNLPKLGNHDYHFNLNFVYYRKFFDHTNTWCIPPKLANAGPIPMVLAVHVNKANQGVFYRYGNFYLTNSEGEVDSLVGNGSVCHDFANFEGKTLFFPFIDDADGNWVYFGQWDCAIYLPVLLLLVACVICNWGYLFSNPKNFIEQITALGISFATLTIQNLNHTYVGTADLAVKNYDFYIGLFGNLSCVQFLDSPAWFLLNRIWSTFADVSLLLPVLCMYGTALIFLKFLKKLLQEKLAYIVWAILLATPWFMFYNFGLHSYRFLYITHNPLMLGFGLFLYGTMGYLYKFNHKHGVAWILAAMCHPMLGSAICVFLLHKHLPKFRYLYLGLCCVLYFVATQDRLLDSNELSSNPILIWIMMAAKGYANKDYAKFALNYINQAYDSLVIIFAILPCIFVAIKSKDIIWKSLARVVITLHIMWFLDSATSNDLIVATTLSAVVAIHFYRPYFDKIMNNYNAKFTAISQQSEV